MALCEWAYSVRELTPRAGFESLCEKAEGRSANSGPPNSLRWLPVRWVRASAQMCRSIPATGVARQR